MNFKNTLLLILFLCCKIDAQEIKLGKVTIAELEEKKHPQDTTAFAAILYKKSRIFFTYKDKNGFSLNNEVTFRVKIYKKEGINWANFEVPYYVGYENLSDDVLSFKNAATYNLELGKIIKTKLDSDGSFKTKTNENWKKGSISMPNVKVGSIVEFSYVLKSEDLVKLPIFNFQYSIPVNYAEYKTEIPEFYIYKAILNGFVQVQADQKFVTGSSTFENEYHQSQTITYKQINSSYIAKEVPPIIEEEFIDNFKNYEASIHNELERTRFPDVPIKDYAVTWEGVAKTIFEHKDFGEQLKESNYLISDLKLILNNVESKEERLKLIFKFIQDKMNWNHEYGYYTNKGVLAAYQDRTGNVAEINFILITMLRLAGIQADPVLISTIEHGIPVYPSRTNFNYVVAMAEIEGKQILLDATHKYTTQNILPLNALNWNGRLIRTDGTSIEVDLVPSTTSVHLYNLKAKVNGEGQISGELRSRISNYEAYKFRDKYADMNTESYIEIVENLYNGIVISDYVLTNKNFELLNPVDENFKFTSSNHSELIGGKIFINPMLFFVMNKNPFIKDKRVMPIYFGYPTTDRYYINIEIPDGYEIESLPKGLNLSTADGSLIFKYLMEKNENIITVTVQSELKSAVVIAENYQMLKDFYQNIVNTQKDKIVLKKIK
jgi:hypothetical protein